ncbi:MAG: Sec-independent protein translocase protein TatC [Pedosphaera sp.]|nr:Sec-independent protein translocase protein TatC [Pedosphaera sp.]
MANEPDEGHSPEEEDEGGPVKSFLDHLEDLRWTLIKSAVAIAIGVVICLMAGRQVMQVLLWPLQRATISYPGTNQVVTVSYGSNKFGSYVLNDEQQQRFNLGTTNRFVALQLEPVNIPNGTNSIQVLALKVDPNKGAAEAAQHFSTTIANFGPADAFMTAFHVAIYAGAALASPFIFYFVAQFVFPALKLNEKRYVYRGLFFGLGLFLTGICFCYFVLMPVALSASQMYSNWMGFSANIWKAEEYIGFVCKFMLGMGLGFEMPVVLLVLVKLGILDYGMLKKARPYMIVICFTLGAILTTPEVITQVLMAIPLLMLYEISVWIAWYWERQERKKAEATTD